MLLLEKTDDLELRTVESTDILFALKVSVRSSVKTFGYRDLLCERS
jgi:hypothetical protein